MLTYEGKDIKEEKITTQSRCASALFPKCIILSNDIGLFDVLSSNLFGIQQRQLSQKFIYIFYFR